MLRLIENTLKAGKRAGIPVAMCGEMAGDPRYTRLLLGLGLDEFSVHPAAVLEIKHLINGTDAAHYATLAREFLDTGDDARRRELRQLFEATAD